MLRSPFKSEQGGILSAVKEWTSDVWALIRQVELGDLGTWVAGIATATGLWFAGIQIRDNRRERKAQEDQRRQDEFERREALARAVAISSLAQREGDGWTIEYTLLNGGDYPIESVVVVAHSLDPGCKPRNQQLTAFQMVIGTMHQAQLHKETVGVHFDYREPVFGELTALASVIFTDTWRQTWWRAPGEIERMDGPARIS
jgi:hypothetical protein